MKKLDNQSSTLNLLLKIPVFFSTLFLGHYTIMLTIIRTLNLAGIFIKISYFVRQYKSYTPVTVGRHQGYYQGRLEILGISLQVNLGLFVI